MEEAAAEGPEEQKREAPRRQEPESGAESGGTL
jgi:hypothetical protein